MKFATESVLVTFTDISQPFEKQIEPKFSTQPTFESKVNFQLQVDFLISLPLLNKFSKLPN